MQVWTADQYYLPQWSPPLKDRSTGPERRQLGEHPAAAMEPAANGRETGHLRVA